MPPVNAWGQFKENRDLASFLNQLEEIPWFANVGNPIPSVVGRPQVLGWEDWPGPEDPEVSELHARQQALHDEIISSSGHDGGQASELWDAIQAGVLQLASKRVPYDANKDPWYPPNAAAWHAAWTAGLMGLCLFTKRLVPSELQEQWKWFADGHWPGAWEGDYPRGKLVVY